MGEGGEVRLGEVRVGWGGEVRVGWGVGGGGGGGWVGGGRLGLGGLGGGMGINPVPTLIGNNFVC